MSPRVLGVRSVLVGGCLLQSNRGLTSHVRAPSPLLVVQLLPVSSAFSNIRLVATWTDPLLSPSGYWCCLFFTEGGRQDFIVDNQGKRWQPVHSSGDQMEGSTSSTGWRDYRVSSPPSRASTWIQLWRGCKYVYRVSALGSNTPPLCLRTKCW
jgi:hypothetical protein